MTRATLRQCVILLDGWDRGARAAGPSAPIGLSRVGDRSALAWLVRELTRFGVTDALLLTADRSGAVEHEAHAIRARLPIRTNLRVMRIPAGAGSDDAGSGRALFHAREHLDSRFLLCRGDWLFDTNVADLLAAAALDPPDSAGRMVVRPSIADEDGTVVLDGDRIVAFAPRSRAGSTAMVGTGIAVFTRGLVDALGPACSPRDDVLPVLAAAGRLFGTIDRGLFVDVEANDAPALSAIVGRLRRRALFLDRDGVINVDHGYVSTRDRFEWTPGARAAIAQATRAGWHVFIVTNQSGIARGYYEDADVRSLHAWLADEVRVEGGTIDDVRHCPFHPDAKHPGYRALSDWRKPAPGMLLDLIRVWELDPARCLMIGDQDTDLLAAAAAGVAGHKFPAGHDLAAFIAPLLG